MQTGKINVQTENIFPIIKKFLYSDHEIFLRELVSNAVDATQKFKTLVSLGEARGETANLRVMVKADKAAKTITISDQGIGMTADEIEKYITQIAFSGATEFVEKYKDKVNDAHAIIGHFGLGFYSAFMVAGKVEIHSLSHKEGSEPVLWECDGNPDYKIGKGSKSERGTDIVLHLAEDSLEFLENYRIEELLKKYCRFLPVPIQFGTRKEYSGEGDKKEEKEVDNIVNNTAPAWVKKPSELSEDDYKKFYHELYPMVFDEPLFHIHLNVDYPFNLTGILYFPKLKKGIEVQKDKIQLYCNQVFVTDSVENIVPDFLTLLKGVIDSPDIPLNVSRSYLQSDANVKKISSHITKKVADKLQELFTQNRESFESKWDDLKVFVNYGMLSEEKFYEKARHFALFKNTEGKYFTIDEFTETVKPIQTNKENKLIFLYTNNIQEQHSFIAAATERGYQTLLFDSPIDPHYIDMLEKKLENCSFVRVDAESIDQLIQKEDQQPEKLTEEEKNKVKPLFETAVSKDKFTVSFASLSEKDAPVTITHPEFMRRLKEMQAMGGTGMGFYGQFPESYKLVINTNHPLISKILSTSQESDQKQLIKQSIDLAMLSQNLLKGEDLTTFIKRSYEIMN